jgi:hypothetical protein
VKEINMSAETDVALMVELEEQINQRIRDGMYKAINGYATASPVSNTLIQLAVASSVKASILSDNVFITDLAKRIGQRLQYLQY